MASIKEKLRDGKPVSYRFTVFLGRDKNGKQNVETMTWHPPSNLSLTKARTAAERAARQWELSLKGGIRESQDLLPIVSQPSRSDDFVDFVNNTWFPLEIEGSDRKPKTVSTYKSFFGVRIPSIIRTTY